MSGGVKYEREILLACPQMLQTTIRILQCVICKLRGPDLIEFLDHTVRFI